MNNFTALTNKECNSYNTAVDSVIEFLEENEYDREEYLIEAIVDECYESDGTIFTLVASEDEIRESVETNSLF